MPYVKQEIRNELDDAIINLSNILRENSTDETVEGNMNYTITTLLEVIKNTSLEKRWRYKFINRAIGVLECCKLEFYRRLASIYEDRCIVESGDIEVYEKM